MRFFFGQLLAWALGVKSPSTGRRVRFPRIAAPEPAQRFLEAIRGHKLYKFLSYTNRHKLYVFRAGLATLPKLRSYAAGSRWRLLQLQAQYIYRLIIHDIDKYKPGMLRAYAEAFYGDQPLEVAGSGYYHKPGVKLDYDRAWKRHQAWGHHWQAHVLIEDEGRVRALAMPLLDRLEMLDDWRGAGAAQGKPDTKLWYLDNWRKQTLEPTTRAWVEAELGVTEQDKREHVLFRALDNFIGGGERG